MEAGGIFFCSLYLALIADFNSIYFILGGWGRVCFASNHVGSERRLPLKQVKSSVFQRTVSSHCDHYSASFPSESHIHVCEVCFFSPGFPHDKDFSRLRHQRVNSNEPLASAL